MVSQIHENSQVHSKILYYIVRRPTAHHELRVNDAGKAQVAPAIFSSSAQLTVVVLVDTLLD